MDLSSGHGSESHRNRQVDSFGETPKNEDHLDSPPRVDMVLPEQECQRDRREPARGLRRRRSGFDFYVNFNDENAQDLVFSLNLPVARDLTDELWGLERKTIRGYFKQGISLFEQELAPHLDCFSAVVLYADLLLEQGNVGEARRFIDSRLSDPAVPLCDEAVLLLKLLKSLAGIYTHGAMIPALEMTLQAVEYLRGEFNQRSLESSEPRGIHIQLIETCLQIIRYTYFHSSFLLNEPFNVLLCWGFSDGRFTLNYYESRTTDYKCPSVGDWYRHLIEHGYSWESHRVLRSTLPLLGDNRGKYAAMGGFEHFANVNSLSEAPAVFCELENVSAENEQSLLTELANGCLLADFFHVESDNETVQAVRHHFLERAKSLSYTIYLDFKHMINTRQYMEWALQQEVLGATEDYQLGSLNLERGINPKRVVHAFVGPRQPQEPGSQDVHEPRLPEGEIRNDLEVILDTFVRNGCYRHQQCVLGRLFRGWVPCDFERSLKLLDELAHLYQNTTQDMVGYGQCLIEEWLLIRSVDLLNLDDRRVEFRNRLADFNRSLLSRFHHAPSVRKRTDDVFLDNPILAWDRDNAWLQLISQMGEKTDEELATVTLSHIQAHFPKHDIAPCPGCYDCGKDITEDGQAPMDDSNRKAD